MTAQEKKTTLLQEIIWNINSLKIPSKFVPYIEQFIKDCNLHQLQNLSNNMTEFKKFITESTK